MNTILCCPNVLEGGREGGRGEREGGREGGRERGEGGKRGEGERHRERETR